ncbi:MAG: hypothetical protein VX872_02615, partial [Candidatus Thermoplasmatota archaeon]|nr:hypothetical protein [Candidatus Thermoplasmatota archaeon]
MDLPAGQGVRCECLSDAFEGTTVDNAAATDCVEKTCVNYTCEDTSICSDGSHDDGYACVCKSSHIGVTVWNGNASCTERTCTQTGFDPNDCGENAECTSTGIVGIECSCLDGFDGNTTINERATCVEKTCDGVDCGAGAFCQSSTSGDGYECVCDVAHTPNVVQNGPVTCTERTCSNLGSDIGTCGNNTICVNVSIGIRCD